MTKKINASREDLVKIFGSSLRDGLMGRYKKIPTAAFFVREFNLRSHDEKGITVETARRWITGLTIPDFGKLIVLHNWLELDLNSFAKFIDHQKVPHTTSKELFPIPKEIEAVRAKQNNDLDKLAEEFLRQIEAIKNKTL